MAKGSFQISIQAVRVKFCSAANLTFVSTMCDPKCYSFFVAVSVLTFFTCKHYKIKPERVGKQKKKLIICKVWCIIWYILPVIYSMYWYSGFNYLPQTQI